MFYTKDFNSSFSYHRERERQFGKDLHFVCICVFVIEGYTTDPLKIDTICYIIIIISKFELRREF